MAILKNSDWLWIAQIAAAIAVVALLLWGLRRLLSWIGFEKQIFRDQQIRILETRLVDTKTRLVLAKIDNHRVAILIGANNNCMLHLPENDETSHT